MNTLAVNTSRHLTLGQGVQSKVYAGCLNGELVCAVKRYYKSDAPIQTHALREVKHMALLSSCQINVESMQVEPTREFTGVPRPLAVKYCGARSSLEGELYVAMPLVSKQSLAQLMQKHFFVDMSAPMHAWIVQGLFILASAQAHEILHRDIKAEHLMLDESFSLALIDWGLSTRCPDNSFLTEYVTTYPYRPPEIFAYTMSFLGPEHARVKRDRLDSMASFLIKPASQPIRPYWCESDLYSFAMSIIMCLCGRIPFAFDPTEPVFVRQQRHMFQLYKWHGIWPSLLAELNEPTGSDTFASILARHWRECFEAKTTSVMCPFDSLEQATSQCPPRTLEQRLDRIKDCAYPCPWVYAFLDRMGPLLLRMCHPDPDERPNTLSLLGSMHENRSLQEWQRVGKVFFARPAN
jgi:serine/threonine protein kinase